MPLALEGHAPRVAPTAYVDHTAEVAGRVTIGDGALVGIDAMALSGATIGAGALVAARGAR